MSLFEKFITEGNKKADELAKAGVGAVLDGRGMAEIRARTVQQRREEVYGALQHAASFHCLVEKWKDCKELNLKSRPQEKWTFLKQKSGSKDAPCGVVCSSKNVSLHETLQKQQTDEHVRNMCTDDKAEEREKVNEEAKEEEGKNEKSEFEGEKGKSGC